MSSLYAKGNSVIPVTGVDFSDKEGYLVKNNNGAPALNDSATVPAVAVVLDGAAAAKQTSLGILGATPGLVRLKLGGTVKALDRLMQKNDGTVVVDAAGARVLVGVAVEAGDAGDLILAAVQTPVYVAA